ncbi:MAG: secondary thiamine-phosphate synthase enzyme YjbQ [Candidatus Aminicenantales bacterium]
MKKIDKNCYHGTFPQPFKPTRIYPRLGIYLVCPRARKYYILYFRHYLYTRFFVCQVVFFDRFQKHLSDVLMAMKHIVPDALPYRHSEGNSPAHVKAVLTGTSVTLIVEDGQMQLGTWQGIYFCEFDGPRRRQVWVKFLARNSGT